LATATKGAQYAHWPDAPEWADISYLQLIQAQSALDETEAGLQDFEMELVSIDDDWRKNRRCRCPAAR
jgi:peptide/nickel transport system substrate-binding protein